MSICCLRSEASVARQLQVRLIEKPQIWPLPSGGRDGSSYQYQTLSESGWNGEQVQATLIIGVVI